MENLSTGNIIAYATAIIGVIVLIATNLPRIFGPLGRVISDWSDSRRRAQSKTRDADVQELKDQVAELQNALGTLREKARKHSEWDRLVYRELLSRGVDIGFPPDLF